MKIIKSLLSLTLAATLAATLAGCYSVPENIKMGIVKLSAAVELMSPHNAAHCENRIIQIREMLEGELTLEERLLLETEMVNELNYHKANSDLPEVVRELEAWALEKDVEE